MKFVITSGVLMFEWTGMVCTHILYSDFIDVSKANIIHVVHIINQWMYLIIISFNIRLLSVRCIVKSHYLLLCKLSIERLLIVNETHVKFYLIDWQLLWSPVCAPIGWQRTHLSVTMSSRGCGLRHKEMPSSGLIYDMWPAQTTRTQTGG